MDPPISIPHEFLTRHPKSEWNPDVLMPERVGLIDLPLKDSDTARVSDLELVWTPIGHFRRAYFLLSPRGLLPSSRSQIINPRSKRGARGGGCGGGGDNDSCRELL